MHGIKLCLLASVLLLPTVNALAQVGPLADKEIRGWVRDARTNKPIPGAVVEVFSTEAGGSLARTSVGGSGRFSLRVDVRRAAVVATAPGYQPMRVVVNLVINPHQTVLLMLRPKKSANSPALLSNTDALVNVRTLAIPEKARKQFNQAQKVLDKNGKLAAAIKHLRKAVEHYPEYFEAYHLLGTIHMEQRQWEEANGFLEKALALNEEFAPSYIALGTIRNLQRNYVEAEKMLGRGLKLDPASWLGHMELCKCHFYQGRLKEAEAHGLRAHELRETALEVHLVLADIYMRGGSLETSKAEYQHFLDLAPAHPMAGRVQAQIQQLDKVLAGEKVNP